MDSRRFHRHSKTKRLPSLILIRDADLLVHHHSKLSSFHRTICSKGPASDPKVLAIKITLHNNGHITFISNPSQFLAAEEGKQIVCLVELKARFDEEPKTRSS